MIKTATDNVIITPIRICCKYFAMHLLILFHAYTNPSTWLKSVFFNHVVFQIELQFWNIGSISPRVLFPLTGASDTEI